MVAEVNYWTIPGRIRAGRSTLEQISLAVVEAFLTLHPSDNPISRTDVMELFMYTKYVRPNGVPVSRALHMPWEEWCSQFKVSVEGMKSRSRLRPVVTCRQMFFAIATDHGYTTKKMGDFLGRDHATAIHGRRAHKNNLRYMDYRNIYERSLYLLKTTTTPDNDEVHEIAS